ncbi:hypothetical protein PoB_004329800 [Plakobranchus ocellatus]|uniref:Uncharacterized protein n=1 Tax=Plakobranchus ocellatus TaxID=259542 RepID=A0AAV4BB46_9GAST|nr:hypothetical protein PoB_004329800 [Plakobranchus ocellatus]
MNLTGEQLTVVARRTLLRVTLRTQDEAFGPQKGDLRLLGSPAGQGNSSGARTHDRRIPADLREVSLTTVPPKPPHPKKAAPAVLSH